MTRQTQDVTIYAGDTVNIRVTTYDGDVTGTARKDIANSSIAWVVYDPDADGVILTKATADAITITDGLNGLFIISLIPADTEDVPPATYRHEAEITDSSGNVSTVLTGDFIVKESRA